MILSYLKFKSSENLPFYNFNYVQIWTFWAWIMQSNKNQITIKFKASEIRDLKIYNMEFLHLNIQQ